MARVRIKDFENWLDSARKSPAEMALGAACGTSSVTKAAAHKAAAREPSMFTSPRSAPDQLLH